MYILNQKLKILKAQLKIWNKTCFGNVDIKVSEALHCLDNIQKDIITVRAFENLLFIKQQAKNSLQQALTDQEVFWQGKSRINWHLRGDRNPTFFHLVNKMQRSSNHISLLKKDDQIYNNQADAKQLILQYFSFLFAFPNRSIDNDLTEKVIPSLVTDE